ncbi:alpha/beta-hydrolase [Coniochaeta sp. PMI_546]|nr:alpha/beta-hydrolase [Coniochaeta sp. PMI_546]
MPVPFLGRLNIPEYIALVGSFFLVGFEAIIRVLTLALPTSLLNLFYRASRRLFNKFTSPAEKRAERRRKHASDFVDLCALFGYTAEEHVVQTKDGFLLGLHRLAWKKGEEDVKVNSGPRSLKKRVIYLHHGLLMNSEVWVCLTDAQRALPFLLVEKGFDVWLGNNRGNKYSKKSVHHSPTTLEFWNFSIDEFAFHDIPDSIAYILETTGQKSLSYIGFSQGTAQAFGSLAIHPKLNTQVNVFIALAPAMSPAGLHNGIVDALVKASPQVLFLLFGRRSILSSATMWQEIIYPPLFTKVIDLSLAFLFNWRTKNISTSQKLAAYPHLYSFTSTKSVVHWFQIIRNKSFQMYDDDVHPPISLSSSSKYTKVAKYPTRNIKTPIVLVYGGSDSLVDIKVMLRELPKQTIATGIPHYEHLDFLWARDVDTMVFPHVFDALESFTGAEHTKEEYERYHAARHTSLSAHASFSVLVDDDDKARRNSVSDVADSDVATSKDGQDTETEGRGVAAVAAGKNPPPANGSQPVRSQNMGAPRQQPPQHQQQQQQQQQSQIPVPSPLPARLSGRRLHGRNGSVDEGSGSDQQSSPDRPAHTDYSDGPGRRTPETPTRRRKAGGGSGSGSGAGDRGAAGLSLDSSVQSMREGKGIALGASRAVGGVERVTTQRAGEGL